MALLVRQRGIGGIQKVYKFDNGYGASVVMGAGTYGFSAGLWELAVIKFNDDTIENFNIVYDTPITDDVIGYLSEKDVEDYLKKIADLK